MKGITRRIAESLVEAAGNARKEFERALTEIEGADDVEEVRGPRSGRFSGVLIANKDRIKRWFESQGYLPIEVPGVEGYTHPELDVVVTIQPAFGALVSAGFADLPRAGRRVPYHKRANGHSQGSQGGMTFPGEMGPVH